MVKLTKLREISEADERIFEQLSKGYCFLKFEYL